MVDGIFLFYSIYWGFKGVLNDLLNDLLNRYWDLRGVLSDIESQGSAKW